MVAGLPLAPNREWAINQGLVAWWLGIASNGAIWHDIAGFHHGVLTNMDPKTDWVSTGQYWCPRALNFDGSNDRVQVPNSGPLNVPYITATFWFRPIFPFSTNGGVFAKGDSSNRQYWIWWNGSNLTIQIDGGGTGGLTGTLSLGQWHHIGLTYDGASKDLYLNGKLNVTYSQTTGTILTDNDDLLIGRLPGFAHAHMDLADLRIWNRRLTAAEVRVVYLDSLQGNRLALRQWPSYQAIPPAAPPGGLSIPVAMHHYKQLAGVN